MNRFERVIEILDQAVGGSAAPVGGPHRAFWRGKTRDQFVVMSAAGKRILTLGSAATSNIILALRGETPFGADTGNPDGLFSRMPAGLEPVSPADIAFIAQWIDDGCPEDPILGSEIGALELLLNGAPSGAGFVVAGPPDARLTATLSVRTTDGSAGEVTVRSTAASAVPLTVAPAAIQVSDTPVTVAVQATRASGALNDAAIEVVQGSTVVGHIELTAIEDPRLVFAGRFQCRLATDRDPWDHPWGINASFGSFAVEGPDVTPTDEPPMDRIIRFQDPVGLRPFCGPIGVSVTAIEAEVGSSRARFTAGDPLIGEPVRLGPNSVFDSQNDRFAPAGFEPITDFRFEIGSAIVGASAPSVPRPTPDDPPGSTAPYADGVIVLDDVPNLPPDLTPWKPSDLGYPEATWRLHAAAVTNAKLVRLMEQVTTPGSAEERVRQARIQKHQERLGGIRAPFQLLERYRGLIDREITIQPNPTGVLAYLASLNAIEFYADFFDFDVDCHTGSVVGTLSAPATPTEPSEAPARAAALAPRRRVPRSPEALAPDSPDDVSR